jgi:hypothetical protein
VSEVNGKVQVSGQVAVMAINALLVKRIFDANPRKEFFIEESYPLDWMYPHLSPHGLILALSREPMEKISDELVQKDQVYWTRFVDGALGKWLTTTTSVEVTCDFAERVFLQKEQEPSGRTNNLCATITHAKRIRSCAVRSAVSMRGGQ